MTVYECLQNILELSHPLHEAKKKLKCTYMRVNGDVLYISNITDDHIEFYSGGVGEEVALNQKLDLEVFLPETGLYSCYNGNVYYLEKFPKRQWQRSYSSEFYTLKEVYCKQDVNKYTKMTLIGDAKFSHIAVLPNGAIYHHKDNIGFVNEDNIVCTKDILEQELMDWSRDV